MKHVWQCDRIHEWKSGVCFTAVYGSLCVMLPPECLNYHFIKFTTFLFLSLSLLFVKVRLLCSAHHILFFGHFFLPFWWIPFILFMQLGKIFKLNSYAINKRISKGIPSWKYCTKFWKFWWEINFVNKFSYVWLQNCVNMNCIVWLFSEAEYFFFVKVLSVTFCVN